jgi:hypothetical protein
MAISQINSNSLASGVPASSNMPAGSVLQVVSTNYSGNASTTSTTPVDLGSLTLSITPKSATSKIQLTWTVAGVCTGNNNSTTYQTIIFVADASNNVVCRISDASVPGGASSNPMAYYSGTFQVSPATTSALTYKIRWYSPTSASIQMNNYVTNSGTMSNITAMEIAA